MYEEIFELINKGEINKAQEQIEKISDDDPKKYNLNGLIHFNKKELEKAKEQFEKGLKINPIDSDLLFNYGYLLKEMNQEMESWRYLMRIHDKDWATYDLLGDIEFKNRSKLASLRFYLKAAELTDTPQMKNKFLEIRNKIKKDTKIAFLCLPGLDNFLKDIVETFSLGYDVKLVVSTDGNEITEAIKWADIVWLEWANDLAVFATNKVPEIANKKVICRLLGYEIFSKFPEKINWELVDKLMFINEHKKELFKEIYSKVNVEKIVIKSGIDLDKFAFKLRKKNYNLLIMGNINYRKGFETLLLSFQHLLETDNKYMLYIKGIFQDLRYKDYILNIIKEMKIENNIIFIDQYIDDIDSWGERFGYILSTSIEESFHYTIGEFMSKGIKPVINSWPSAREMWPNECIFATVRQFQEKILEDKYDSESYRRFIEDNYSLEEQINALETALNTLEKVNKKINKKVAQDQKDLFLDNMISKFIEFTPYTDKYIDSFDFEGSKIGIGKVEKITDEVSLIEFIVKNKKGQQLALQNIWYNHSTKQITFPDNISLSKNKKIIQNFVHQILDSRLSYIGNMGGFINDEEILEDIKENQLAYNWERGIPATQFMPAFGYLKTMLRYSFVSKFIKESDVILDAACGFGYGSAYFSKFCKNVYALDLAEDNIKFGESTYSFANIKWILGDVTALPFENDKFDVYVSFETFEHLPLNTIDNYIEEAIRVVKKDGLFILSTPNRETRQNIHNPFHIKEYSFRELSSILKQYFKNIKFFSQVNFTVTEGYNEHASNFIAVCTNNKLLGLK
jgi:ubiquinone/menaquinone biosynthesis C-methylase UbiE/glycosyltransferase involved in cell wall biosynthesis